MRQRDVTSKPQKQTFSHYLIMEARHISLVSYRSKGINAYLVKQGLDHTHNDYGVPVDEENQERAHRKKRHTVKIRIDNLEDGIYRYVEAGGADFNKVITAYLKIKNGGIIEESNNLNALSVAEESKGFPELEGSSKQVSWAISIREKYLAELKTKNQDAPDWINTTTSAKWYIDNKQLLERNTIPPSKNTGATKKRVDFSNPETQKALKNLVEYLKSNFDLPQGENYQTIAEDAIGEAIQTSFVVSNTPLHEAIYKRALSVCASFVRSDEQKDEQVLEESEPDAEDVYNAIDSIVFSGSEKQIKWATDIAHKAAADIAVVWKKKDSILPTEAKWWIDNRNNIGEALAKL